MKSLPSCSKAVLRMEGEQADLLCLCSFTVSSSKYSGEFSFLKRMCLIFLNVTPKDTNICIHNYSLLGAIP